MKTPEDEAFEDIERRQGGGFPAKRAMAVDKLYHSTEARWCENFVEVKHPHIENEIVRFYFTQPVQRPWVGLEKSDMPDGENPMFDHEYFIAGMVFASNVLKGKNT